MLLLGRAGPRLLMVLLLAPLLGWEQIPFTDLESETLGTVQPVSAVPLSPHDCPDQDTAVPLVD